MVSGANIKELTWKKRKNDKAENDFDKAAKMIEAKAKKISGKKRK